MNAEELKQFEALRKSVLPRILSRDAYERLSRVKTVKPETAMQLEAYLIQLYQAGQIKKEISDTQIKQILGKLSERKSFNIRRL